MSTTAENMMALTGRVSVEQAHEALTAERVRRELHGAQDDVGDWAHAHWNSLRVGLADARLAKLADEENARVLAESVRHFGQACRGHSCRQGRLPCREKCPVVELPYPDADELIRGVEEMACTAGDDPPSYFTLFGKLAIAALLAVLVLGCWLAPLAG